MNGEVRIKELSAALRVISETANTELDIESLFCIGFSLMRTAVQSSHDFGIKDVLRSALLDSDISVTSIFDRVMSCIVILHCKESFDAFGELLLILISHKTSPINTQQEVLTSIFACHLTQNVVSKGQSDVLLRIVDVCIENVSSVVDSPCSELYIGR